MQRKSTCDILIITAIKEELKTLQLPLNLNFNALFHIPNLPLTYYKQQILAKSRTYNIAVLCLYSMGNPKSSLKTSAALNHLNPSFVIMFGLAGGIEGEVELTDVIVSDKIIYTGQGKHYPNGRKIRPESLQVDPLLLQRMRDYELQSDDKRNYPVHFGEYAVGEDVVASDEARDAILDIFPKVIGVEMESYGVGLAATYKDMGGKSTPFIAIRGVCDFADPNKNDEYRLTALNNAANFLLGFLNSGLLSEPTKHIETTYIAIHHYSVTQRSSIKHAVDRYLSALHNEDIIEIPIDQTNVASPEEALSTQTQVLEQLSELQKSNPDCQLGYFGIAHIPFTFHLGRKIHRNTIDVFANDRSSAQWFELPDKSSYPEPQLYRSSERVLDDGDVIVRFSVSYEVGHDDIEGIVKNPIADFHIYAESPKTDIIDSIAALNAYTRAFNDVLHTIEDQIPNTKRIHVFAAVPPTLAFRCGQQVNERIEAQILVYEYNRQHSPRYKWALNLYIEEIVRS